MDVLLSQLVYGGKIDSRAKPNRGVDIDTLANSIRTLGLILPLAVMPDGEDKYRVVDGNRRLEALKIVHKGKKDVVVPVLLQDADIATARAMSLAANIERLPLHPVDQFEAFAAIAAEGKSLEDIAAAFGINVRQVSQRLALGTLHPKARQQYREGRFDAEMAKGLTRLTHTQQEELCASDMNRWQLESAIRDMAGDKGYAFNSEIARFVSRETYVEAGGTFARDLFVPEGEEKWADTELVMKLANEKIIDIKKFAAEEGWSWVEQTDKWIGNDYVFVEQKGIVELAPDAQAELASLKGRQTLIEELIDYAERENVEQVETEPGVTMTVDAIFEESREVERAIAEIEQKTLYFTPEQKAELGVVIDNRFEVHYGMTRRAGATSESESALGEKIAEAKEQGKGELSNPMMMELNAILTNAARIGIADHAYLALDLLLVQLIESDYGLTKGIGVRPGIGIRIDHGASVLPIVMHGMDVCVELLKSINYGKQKNLQNKMAALAILSTEEKLSILAWFTAQSLQQQNAGMPLIVLLNNQQVIDVRKHWTPDVENFFGRLTKKQLQAIADEDKLSVDTGILKRDEAAVKICAEMRDDWLPVAMRPKKK